MEEKKPIAAKTAYIGAVSAVIINSFISIFLSLILRTGVHSSVVTFYRLIIVSAIMLPYALSKKAYRNNIKSLDMRTWMFFVIYTFTKAGGFIFWAEGLRLGAPAFTMTTLSNMQPIFVVVFLYILLHEKTSARSLGGIAICLAGVTIIGIQNISELGSPIALGVIIICCCCNALNNIFGRVVRQKMDLIPMMGISYFSAGLIAGSYALIRGASFAIPHEAIPPLLGVSLICTLMGHSLNIWSLKYIKSVTVSVLSLIGPFCTAISGFFILDQVPQPIVFVGAGIMVAGLLTYQRAELHDAHQKELAAAANASK